MNSLMGGGASKSATQATAPTKLAGMRIQTSVFGTPITIVLGTQRVPGVLLDYEDFKSIPQYQAQQSGGKGGNSHSNAQPQLTGYKYTAAVVIGLCEGQANGLFNVWDTKGKLAMVSATEIYTVPGGGGGINVSNAGGNYRGHIGISRNDTYSLAGVNDYGSPGAITLAGTQQSKMLLVGGAPAAGQYQHNGTGGYTFSAADAGKNVSVTYVYALPDSTTSGAPAEQLSLTFFPGTRPQTPWTYMSSAHPGNALSYAGLCYVANSAFDLGTQGQLPNYTYEVSGLAVYGGNVIDANPSDMISQIVGNAFWGLGQPTLLADLVSAGNSLSNYCIASGTFLSLVIDSQSAASSWLQQIIDCCNAAPVWSNGTLKIIPYCDKTLVGNGAIYSPNTTPIYDLNDDDFQPNPGSEPVIILRDSAVDAYNAFQLEWLNRANHYNPEIVEAKDDASIATYNLRPANPQQMHCITTAGVAQIVVDNLLKRSVYIRKRYQFKLDWRYCLLEPMDMVTLSDSGLGLVKEPVRIISIEEDEQGMLTFEAEEFPFGTATATAYPKQIPTSFAPTYDADPGLVGVPVVLECPAALSASGQHEVWLGASGSAITNYARQSEQSGTSPWTAETNVTVTQDTQLDPNGGNTADTLATGATANQGINQLATDPQGNPLLSVSGTKNTYSVWLVGTGIATLFIQRAGALDVETLNVNVGGLQRFSFTHSATWTGSGQIQFGVRLAAASQSIGVWGHQLEVGQSMSPYIQTTTVAVAQPNPNYGGCSVYVSYDNATFTKLPQQLFGASRMGLLTASVATGTDPDTSHFASVDLTQSAGTLSGGSQGDADAFRTLCYIDGELCSYQNANLTGTNRYDVGRSGGGAVYLRRGLYGSQIVAHAAGSQFLRLDNGVLKFVYDPAFIGKTIFLKFCAFNKTGLREQSSASVQAYSFFLSGAFNQNSRVGVNIIPNPGFETNIVATPTNTALTVGAKVSDGWTYAPFLSNYIDGSPYFDVKIDNTGPLMHSGSWNLLIRLKTGTSIPNFANYYQALVVLDKIPVTPGQRYFFGGYIRSDQNASFPANVTSVAGIRILAYDTKGAIIGEVPVPGSIEHQTTATGAYTSNGNYYTVPPTISGSVPGFIALFCSCWVLNTTGAAFTPGASLFWDVRFDDLWLILQNSLGDDSNGKQGSSSNVYVGTLTYTSTTTSITWIWNFTANRTDLNLTRQSYNSSQAVTGLSVNTSYNFYPFIDEFNNRVSMVATGGIGSPSWAHTGTNVAWSAEQTRGDHYPLTQGPSVGATTASGTGGGTGGGPPGGACLRHDVLVREKKKGVIPVEQLEIGDFVHCPVAEDTPDGWARVIDVLTTADNHEWVHTFFNCDDWLPTTPGHPFTLSDGTMKRAAELSLESEVPCLTGVTYPVDHHLKKYESARTKVAIDSKAHVFYAGMKAPQIQQHNFIPVS